MVNTVAKSSFWMVTEFSCSHAEFHVPRGHPDEDVKVREEVSEQMYV